MKRKSYTYYLDSAVAEKIENSRHLERVLSEVFGVSPAMEFAPEKEWFPVSVYFPGEDADGIMRNVQWVTGWTKQYACEYVLARFLKLDMVTMTPDYTPKPVRNRIRGFSIVLPKDWKDKFPMWPHIGTVLQRALEDFEKSEEYETKRGGRYFDRRGYAYHTEPKSLTVDDVL